MNVLTSVDKHSPIVGTEDVRLFRGRLRNRVGSFTRCEVDV